MCIRDSYCSEFVADLLGIEGNKISAKDFANLICENYRAVSYTHLRFLNGFSLEVPSIIPPRFNKPDNDFSVNDSTSLSSNPRNPL